MKAEPLTHAEWINYISCLQEFVMACKCWIKNSEVTYRAEIIEKMDKKQSKSIKTVYYLSELPYSFLNACCLLQKGCGMFENRIIFRQKKMFED